MERKIIIYEKDGETSVGTTGEWTYAEVLGVLTVLWRRAAIVASEKTGVPLHEIFDVIDKNIWND